MPDVDYVRTRTWQVSPDPLCLLDKEGRFVAANPAWKPVLGWETDDLVGQPYARFLHPDDVETSLAAFEVVKAGDPVLRFENRYRTSSGDYRWFSWVAVPEGQNFFCIVRDVTDIKQRDRMITLQQEEADLRERFLAILGHDLRNPVGSIMSGVRLLKNEVPSDKGQDILQHMQASASRMSELINNMMDFARVRLGDGIGLNRAPVADIGAVIIEVVEEFRLIYPRATIAVNIEETGQINCDAPRIMQLVSNLLGNATTHGSLDEPIRVDVKSVDGAMELVVCNQGQRIPDDVRQNLFQPFFKGGGRPSPQGLGLGLYISAQIADAHDGTLQVVSDEKETCFILTLPTAM